MRILIADDGSEHSAAAVEFAAELIVGTSAHRLMVLTVIEPAAGLEVEAAIESVEELLDPTNPAAIEANNITNRAVSRLREVVGGDQIIPQIAAGPAAGTIIEKAVEWAADLVILGTHGRGYIKRAVMGSVSSRVLSHAGCSVLIVRGSDGPRRK